MTNVMETVLGAVPVAMSSALKRALMNVSSTAVCYVSKGIGLQ